MSGDEFNLSGDFRGAILNIKSTLTDVSQVVGSLPNVDEATRQKLNELVNQLTKALEEVPKQRQADAEAVAQLTKDLVDKANAERPNRTLLEISGEGLKKAAENLSVVMPTVLTIAIQIVGHILKV